MNLIPGKHYVKTRDGRFGVVMDCGVVFQKGSLHIGNIYEDLTSLWNSDDIIEIFQWDSSLNISFYFDDPKTLKSIWKREDKTKAEIEYENLEEEMSKLKQKMEEWKKKNLKGVNKHNV